VSRVEKPQSPQAQEIPAWVQDYKRRIEQASLEHQQMKPLQYPEQADEGEGELEISDANANLFHKLLSELAQQVVHVVQTCNEEKELLENEFDSFKPNSEILERRMQTDKHRMDTEVAGVGSQMQLQEAVLREIRSRVNILQAQDNQSVKEANTIFEAHKNELESMIKRMTNFDAEILSLKATNIGIQ
jgi:hypothetical protein